MQMDGGTATAERRRENDEEGLEFRAGNYVPHPVGAFRAEFVRFERPTEEELRKNPEWDPGRIRLVFHTEAEMEDGEPFQIAVWTAPSFSPRGRLRPMLVAMGVDVDGLVRDQDKLKAFRLKQYTGGKLMLAIEHEPRKDGQGNRAVIKSFLPLPPKVERKRPKFDDDGE